MKYDTKNKKPLNYFEQQKQRLYPKKFRYYLLPDYLYYCGEKRNKKNSRASGLILLMDYWTFCIMMPLYFYLIPVPILSLSDNWRAIAALTLSIILPIAFGLLRYRKERRSALVNHYRRSVWGKGRVIWIVNIMWLPLALLELWIIKGMGWI